MHAHARAHTHTLFGKVPLTVTTIVNITYSLDDDDTVESTIEEDKGVLSKVKSNFTCKTAT